VISFSEYQLQIFGEVSALCLSIYLSIVEVLWLTMPDQYDKIAGSLLEQEFPPSSNRVHL